MYRIPTLTTRKRNESDYIGTCSCKKWTNVSTTAAKVGTEWMVHAKKEHSNG